MLEWIEANKEWAFSGIGITILGGITWIIWRLMHPRPSVRVALALTPAGRALTISFLNPTDREIIVGNFVLELHTGETMLLLVDELTGEVQQPRPVRAGDRRDFHFRAESLADCGRRAEEFKCAWVQTPVGGGYRSDTAALQRILSSLLRTAAA